MKKLGGEILGSERQGGERVFGFGHKSSFSVRFEARCPAEVED